MANVCKFCGSKMVEDLGAGNYCPQRLLEITEEQFYALENCCEKESNFYCEVEDITGLFLESIKEKEMNYKFDKMILDHILANGPVREKSIFWYMKKQWCASLNKRHILSALSRLCSHGKIELYDPEEEDENEIAWI